MHKKSLALIEQVQKVISEYDFALTLRQIYYQLVARQIIANLKSQYQRLSRLCVIGRDEGMLPEEAFADRLRQVQKSASWEDLREYMETVKESYRKARWGNQDVYLEIWTEKDALRGVIQPITDLYDVNLLVVRGQVSRTAIWEASERFNEQEKVGKLIYLGDFDPSGISIYRSLKERIVKRVKVSVEFQRIALTPEQIEKYDLPEDYGKKKDPNYKRFVAEYGDNVVELDALPPEVLQKLVRDSIEQNIDWKKWKAIEDEEQREQAKLEEIIQGG